MTERRWPADDLGIEWMLLELLCPGPLEGDLQERFVHTVRSGGVDHGRLLELAVRHRLLPMLASALADDSVKGVVPGQLRSELIDVLMANRRRVARLMRAADEVVRELRSEGITVAVTKGAALEPTVYGGLGVRRMNDVDLMIHPADRSRVAAILTRLGYVNGLYDWRTHRLEPLPAHIRAEYRLSPDHLPHFRRLERDGAGTLSIDCANSLTWAAARWQVPMDRALADTVTVPALDGDVELPTLTPCYQFLFTVLHLFRESWFETSVLRGKDRLCKFADVLRLWNAHRPMLARELGDLTQSMEIRPPVAWVLAHTDRIFGTSMTAETGLQADAGEEWLASASGRGGVALRWSGTMRTRLYTSDRTNLFQPA